MELLVATTDATMTSAALIKSNNQLIQPTCWGHNTNKPKTREEKEKKKNTDWPYGVWIVGPKTKLALEFMT